MVDRSYSKFPEIRDYQDRGMKKWMGFYLSEHGSAMKRDAIIAGQEKVDKIELEEKIQLLNQAYLNKLTIELVLSVDEIISRIQGTVAEFTSTDFVFFKVDEVRKIDIKNILSVKYQGGEAT
ncbi:hypothetical protein [Floricoccus penangensis]|uniref:hypothetical protein n=1 Tax=Floricoccus penangensis TaxID=1859475 RepID=UPI002040F2D3|nr:hypothetical protein [Floricoccus penangensis]URZ87932.1 hypothetical protein KIW23_02475 [Floricoccus penangensis]